MSLDLRTIRELEGAVSDARKRISGEGLSREQMRKRIAELRDEIAPLKRLALRVGLDNPEMAYQACEEWKPLQYELAALTQLLAATAHGDSK